MKISIIVTCYNLEHFIGDAIESLLNQHFSLDYEILLIDDASTDGSRTVIQQYNDPKLKTIFLEKNVGAAAAINIAFAQATGEYICRFDGDDKWRPDYLQKASAVLDAHPQVVLVHTDIAFINERHEITRQSNNIPRPASLKYIDHEFKAILHNYYICAPAIMARKAAWDQVMPWGEQFRAGLGDWFISLQMLENGLSCFINEPLAYYRIHSTNMHRSMIKNGIAEKNTLWILDHFKKRPNGVTPAEWRSIYFMQNRNLGLAYFSHDMEKDAKRCFLRAFKYMPAAALADMELMRIWLASLMGKKAYARLKEKLLPGRRPAKA